MNELVMQDMHQLCIDSGAAANADYAAEETCGAESEKPAELGVEPGGIVYEHRNRSTGSDSKARAETVVRGLQGVEYVEFEAPSPAMPGVRIQRNILAQDEVARSSLGEFTVGTSIAGEGRLAQGEQDDEEQRRGVMEPA